MDPLTQGVIGGTAGQLISTPKQKALATVAAFMAGMAPDLDVLIASDIDPLLFLEFHRHFTHALVFIPLGALICALFFRFVLARWFKALSFKQLYWFSFAGYATHAVLDACTTYGTQLLWPFSDARITWNVVSVIDPLFTLPIQALLIIALSRKTLIWSYAAAIYGLAYLGLGSWQNQRALEAAQLLADQRGHKAEQLAVKPSFANIIVWKSVYEYQDRYYVDAVRVGASSKVFPGVAVEKLDLDKHFPWLQQETQQARDVERFRWFSNQYLALDPNDPFRIIDVRYSLIPNQVTGMWGIVLNPKATAQEHVDWTTNRPTGGAAADRMAELWQFVVDDQ